MQISQSCILIVLLAILGNVVAAQTTCQLSIEKAKLRASKGRLRIRGDIAIGNKECKPTTNSTEGITTTVTWKSKKNYSFKDVDNVRHSGNECKVIASWYANPEKYSKPSQKTEVSIPLRSITSVECNKDVAKPVTTKTVSTKKSRTKTKKRTTKTSTKKTSTKKTSTKSTKKTSTKKTTTKKKTSTKKKTTTTTKKSTTTTKKSTTTTKKSTTTTKKSTTTTKKTTTTTKPSQPESSGSTEHYSGKATFFTPNQGACGDWNTKNDYIAALSGSLYGSYSKKSSYCGKKVKVVNKANGKSVTVTVKDACESCDRTHIDLSPAAFAQIGDFNTGILQVDWYVY